MKKNVKFIKILCFFVISFFINTKKTFAQTRAWESINQHCVVDGVATIQGVSCLVANVLSVALTVIGLAGFIMLIVGSLKWLLSGGSSQNVDSAKKTMTYAVVGLIVALSSFMIINLIAQFTGVNVITEFFIPGSDTGLEGGPQWEDVGRL